MPDDLKDTPSAAAVEDPSVLKSATEGSADSLEVDADGNKKKINPKKAAKLAKFQAKQEKLKQQQQQQQQQEPKEKKEKVEKQTKKTEEVYVDSTPKGEKKRLDVFPVAYQPAYVESAWYAWWEKEGFFQPDMDNVKNGVFVIPIPPPNVTGVLHLGHGLTNAIQDTLIRWNRMKGLCTLYLPGCDHAGIATQAVVEKKLWKEEKLTRHDLGREEFIKRVWNWKDEYGHTIYNQLRRFGSSYDWSRACFTLDPNFVTAVTETFIKLHEEGVIYRDTRLVNWSSQLNTALSNLEVDEMELTGRTLLSVPGHDPEKKYEFGVIISFSYPIENSQEKITVATTRLETMLGDVAIAVHPQDKRYQHLIGKYALHPFNGRKLIIVGDESVEMDFGTGAVKITPAHDQNDYLIGKKHNLDFITVFNDNGTINANGAPFEGMMRFDARVAVLEELKKKGLYVETKDNPMVLPICSRSGDVIEPLNKPQWYVNCKEMAEMAMDAVRKGELNIQPKLSEKEWFSWLGNIQDWCISRQLWWGHSIPAFFVQVEGAEESNGDYWVCGRTKEEAFEKAKKKFPSITIDQLKQDEDVLDTWFSAALWPFATLGWPENTKDYETFYPNSLLETGWDILFFWVARMVMFGLKLTGKVPFRNVFCHAMVRDAHGKKMSKSDGNVIDPVDVIQGCSLEHLHNTLKKGNLDPKKVEIAIQNQKRDFPNGIPECGTDAMRFALCNYQGTNRDINLDILRVEGYRKFCNKLWQSTKFVMGKLGDTFVPLESPRQDVSKLSLAEQWILFRMNKAIADVNQNIADYNFMNATNSLYHFWYDFCDVFIEVSKGMTSDSSPEDVKLSVYETLYTCLEYGVRLFHPFMPFVTEELYQRLPRRPNDKTRSVMLAKYPEYSKSWENASAAADFDFVISLAAGARALITQYDIKNSAQVYIAVYDDRMFKLAESEKSALENLISVKNQKITIVRNNEAVPAGCAPNAINEQCSVFLLVRGVVDFDKEIQKLNTKMSKIQNSLSSLQKQMALPDYEEKVKQEIRDMNSNKVIAVF